MIKDQAYVLPLARYWKWTHWQWRCKNGLSAKWKSSALFLVLLLPIDTPLPLQRYNWRAVVIEVGMAEEWPFQRIAVQKFLRKGFVFEGRGRGRVGVCMSGTGNELQHLSCGPKVCPNGLILLVLDFWSHPPLRSAIPFNP